MGFCPSCKNDMMHTMTEIKGEKGLFRFKCDNENCIVDWFMLQERNIQ